MPTTLRVQMTTASSPSDSGSDHPKYFSILVDGIPNIAQSKFDRTHTSDVTNFDFNIQDAGGAVFSVAVRLNGLAPRADDNWRVQYVKITYGSETLVDRPWSLVFDNENRSYELYRRAFDPSRGGPDDNGNGEMRK